MAPPSGLTRGSSRSTPQPSRSARTCAAKASLSSIRPRSEKPTPAFSSAFLPAGNGRGADPGQGLEAVGPGEVARGDEQGGGAVVERAGVAGGDGAALQER